MTVKEVKKLLWQPVRFQGAVYTLESCILWRDRMTGEYKYSVELLDKNNRTVVRAALDEVDKEGEHDFRD